MNRRFWTNHEVSRLRSDYGSIEPATFAILFNRSPNAIRVKAKRLGLRRPIAVEKLAFSMYSIRYDR